MLLRKLEMEKPITLRDQAELCHSLERSPVLVHQSIQLSIITESAPSVPSPAFPCTGREEDKTLAEGLFLLLHTDSQPKTLWGEGNPQAVESEEIKGIFKKYNE